MDKKKNPAAGKKGKNTTTAGTVKIEAKVASATVKAEKVANMKQMDTGKKSNEKKNQTLAVAKTKTVVQKKPTEKLVVKSASNKPIAVKKAEVPAVKKSGKASAKKIKITHNLTIPLNSSWQVKILKHMNILAAIRIRWEIKMGIFFVFGRRMQNR